MNQTDKYAEEIIKQAYDKGGIVYGNELPKELVEATKDTAVDYVLNIYGHISSDDKGGYYGLNEKGFQIARRGYFTGEIEEIETIKKANKTATITSITSVILAIIAIIISIISIIYTKK